MAITRFEDLPSENSPINSENLNGNFDELGVKVGTSVDNNYRVNVLHSRNLFDGKAIYFANATETNITNGKRISNVASGAAFVLYLIKNVSNDVGKTFALKASFTSGRIGIGLCDESGANRILGQYIDTGNTSISYTIPSLTTSKYLAVWLYGSVGLGTATNDYTNIMINEGSTALDYEPFITKNIVVDNEKFTETVGVGSSVDGRNRVNFIKGKNLFDKNSGIMSGFYYSSTGALTSDANYSSQTIFIKVKPNTKYTLSSQNADLMIMCEYDSNKNFIERKYTNPLVSNITYTTGSTTEYIKVSVRNENISSYQLEEGSMATTFESYVTPSINVDGEEIYTKGQNEEYSTNETRIGTFMGKPLYRKVIESTTFTTNFYPISSNIKQFVNQYGYVQRKDYTGIWQFIPSRVGSAMGISFLANNLNDGVQIDWGSSWQSDYANLFNKIVLIVEYTKTTD